MKNGFMKAPAGNLKAQKKAYRQIYFLLANVKGFTSDQFQEIEKKIAKGEKWVENNCKQIGAK